MPDKYHIKTQPVPPRRPRIGKHGVVDWREDCARCHNCVKKACVYDRYRQEAEYIRSLHDVEALFFDCMGCFSCVQDCTKNLLRLTINPEYEKLGNSYWKPDIIKTTWLQAETAKIPVSGAGYRGPFTGKGFDSMWTDMSEIVRPTRDGIHGREYISTSVDIGRKPQFLEVSGRNSTSLPPLVSIPMPLIFDLCSPVHTLPELDLIIEQTASDTGLIAVMKSNYRPAREDHLENIAFCLGPDDSPVPEDILKKTRLVEISEGPDVAKRITSIKTIHPDIVVAIRVELTESGIARAVELAGLEDVEAIHIVSDANGNELGSDNPRFIKDMIRHIHTTLIDSGVRDEITIIAGGGIALPEHMAKAILCGADLVSINLPLLIALECHLCGSCAPGAVCPARLEDIDFGYGVGRMTNLIASWHDQLIELMGAMGIREARRLRGEVGRAMFFENLEEETFGKLYGKRKTA
ncbi:MAG TPA: glutamate synthase-related protein [Deltaproteobacteria bacterium]|nr:glutamate synthase-related protein [Deltaproteobacteria bacterium]HPR56176.1 glutamate synthase-related protein [Deltaproteobacteria bacterium]HXK46449.1 glutamate synthase-related protein [Deltaproteobacteria bacterium]